MQAMNPRGTYQRIGSPTTQAPASPTVTDDIGVPVSPPPEPPTADRLQRCDMRTIALMASAGVGVGFSGLLGVGIGQNDRNILIAGAIGVGLSLTASLTTLLCGRETYSTCRIGDYRAIALVGLAVSAAFGIFTGVAGATARSGS